MAPLFQPWQAARPYAADHPDNWWNGGCPPGYFCEFVSPTFVSADGVRGADYGNPISRAICREIASTTPETIVAETGATMTDALANFNAALRQTVGDFGGNLMTGIGASLPWILAAAVVFLYLNTKQR